MFSLICIGDSLVYGRGEIPSGGWVRRLKEEFETELVHKGVYNLGIPGDTSHSLKKRIENEIKSRVWFRKENDRYVVIVQIGGNDSRSIIKEGNKQTPIDKFEENLNQIISDVLDKNCEIIFINIPPIFQKKTKNIDNTIFYDNSSIKEYNNSISKVCSERKIQFLDLYSKLENLDLSSLICEDGLHPNSKGYDLIYTEIKLFLEEKKIFG